MPTTRDMVEFKIGMPLVSSSGRQIETNDQDFEIFEDLIRRKTGAFEFLISEFYSSQDARIESQINQVRFIRAMLENISMKIFNGCKPKATSLDALRSTVLEIDFELGSQ